MAQDASGAGAAAGARHPGNSRRDGGPDRPPARGARVHWEICLLVHVGLGDHGIDRRDRREAVPVRLDCPNHVGIYFIGQYSWPVRLPGRDQHLARRLRPRLAGTSSITCMTPRPCTSCTSWGTSASSYGYGVCMRTFPQFPDPDALPGHGLDRRRGPPRRLGRHPPRRARLHAGLAAELDLAGHDSGARCCPAS